MHLLVGLGNPGDKYKNNRHNIGFMLVDILVDELKPTTINKSTFRGELYKSGNLLLLKPQTFMNLSGESVKAVKDYYNIEDITVFHDDLDIPLGKIKVKFGGGNGGHNGLKSIDAHIGNEYTRVRLGIGRPKDKSDVSNYVLGDFAKSELECLDRVLEIAKKIALDCIKLDEKEINQKYQLKKSICDENLPKISA
ncbi:MAG: aminoacyl-tRNA hydrolase [Sulfurospirillum sp.]|nr:MAG: aminoacyl-tRNA hydrolase [Sulfurospirillum sp.]